MEQVGDMTVVQGQYRLVTVPLQLPARDDIGYDVRLYLRAIDKQIAWVTVHHPKAIRFCIARGERLRYLRPLTDEEKSAYHDWKNKGQRNVDTG